MSKFRKKPVVVEAEQFFEDRQPWPRGVTRAKLQHNLPRDRDYWSAGAPVVETIHGQTTRVQDGDWIITEPDGEHFYPCKPDIFEATYEPADSPPAATERESLPVPSPACSLRRAAWAINEIAIAFGPGSGTGALVPIGSPDWQQFVAALASPCPAGEPLPVEPSEAAIDGFMIEYGKQMMTSVSDNAPNPARARFAASLRAAYAAERAPVAQPPKEGTA